MTIARVSRLDIVRWLWRRRLVRWYVELLRPRSIADERGRIMALASIAVFTIVAAGVTSVTGAAQIPGDTLVLSLYATAAYIVIILAMYALSALKRIEQMLGVTDDYRELLRRYTALSRSYDDPDPRLKGRVVQVAQDAFFAGERYGREDEMRKRLEFIEEIEADLDRFDVRMRKASEPKKLGRPAGTLMLENPQQIVEGYRALHDKLKRRPRQIELADYLAVDRSTLQRALKRHELPWPPQ